MIQRVVLGVTLAGALAVRLYYLLNGSLRELIGDAAAYDASAVRLITKGFYALSGSPAVSDAHPNAYTVPGYPFFLAAVYRFTGIGDGRLFWVRLLQVLLSTLTVYLLYLLGRRATGSAWVGLLAAVALACYPPAYYANGYLLTEVLYTFVIVLSLHVLLFAAEKERWWWFALAGAVFAAASLVRPTAAPWIVIFVGYLFLKRYGWRRVAVSATALALGFIVVMSPWWVRNYTIYHRFVPFGTISANPLLRSSYLYLEKYPRFAVEWPPALRGDEIALNDYQSRLATQRTLAQFRADPRAFLFRRYLRLRRSTDFGFAVPNFQVDAWVHLFQPWLWLLALIAPLFWLKKAEVWLLWSFLVFFTGVYFALLVFARYLFPVMPLVLLLAIAAVWGFGVLASRGVRKLTGGSPPDRAGPTAAALPEG